MKRIFALILFAFVCLLGAMVTEAQVSSNTAFRFRKLPSFTTCKAGDVTFDTGSSTFKGCTATNTVVTFTTGASGIAWGAITGTLSNQTDLQAALNLKAPLASPTFTGSPVTPSLTLSGNISQAAWTTSGVGLKTVARTLTDTTSSGTVATAYTNTLGGNTVAASSATTFTNYFNSYIVDPIAGTNVTMTNKWALGADSLKVGTSNPLTVSTAGVLTATSPVFVTPTLGLASASSVTIGNAFYEAGSFGGFRWANGTSMQTAGDGIISLYNNGSTSFNRIQFGGTTSSFPSLKRSGTGLISRLADDSADAPFTASNITASGTLAITGETTFGAGGVAPDGGGFKHARVTTGSVSAGATALVTVTWATTFADANYTVQASVQDSTTSSLSLSVVHIESVSASAVTVRVLNNALGSLTGTLHVIAIHD